MSGTIEPGSMSTSASTWPTLDNQPHDTLLMVSATLFDPLRPEQHAPLCASCKGVRHALAGAVDVLRKQCNAQDRLLAKTGYSARAIATGVSDLCWCFAPTATAKTATGQRLPRAASTFCCPCAC